MIGPGLTTELIGVDTNVLLRAILDDHPVQSAAAAALLRSLTPTAPGFVTHVTLAELYWVLSRSHRMSRGDCLTLIHALVRTETLEFNDGESVVRALSLAEDGADFADALIEGTMHLFGVTETVTFDREAARLLGWRLLGGDAPSH